MEFIVANADKLLHIDTRKTFMAAYVIFSEKYQLVTLF